MTDDKQSVAEIAAALTKAQREALLLWDAKDFAAASPERRQELIDGLGRDGIRPLIAAGVATKPSQMRRVSSHLTPLGLAVRAHLASEVTSPPSSKEG